MAKIIEVMNTDLVDPAQFVVDTSVASVPSTLPVLGDDFASTSAGKWFEEGDNLILTGVSINLPYQFGLASGNASLALSWVDSLGNLLVIRELANSGTIYIPRICEMLELPPDGLFVSVPIGSGRLKLQLISAVFNVSMLNVPAILNGTTQNIGSSLRLYHTRALSVVP